MGNLVQVERLHIEGNRTEIDPAGQEQLLDQGVELVDLGLEVRDSVTAGGLLAKELQGEREGRRRRGL